jgi:hypothetical protein
MPGTLTVEGMSAGLVSGYKSIGPVTTTGLNTIGEILDCTLASGDNTIAIPTGAVSVLIVLPAGTTATVKYRTNLNSGDVGLPISPALAATPWLKKDLISGETEVILNSNAGVTGGEIQFI